MSQKPTNEPVEAKDELSEAPIAFLVDVDNTLIDNDKVKEDLMQHLEELVGPVEAAHFWQLYEQVRVERSVVDIPLTLKRYKSDFKDKNLYENVVKLFNDYHFENMLYPGVLETLAYLRSLGKVAILSDGDRVFQVAKIRKSGIEAAVDEVLIYDHKEKHIQQVRKHCPANHYVIIDDKPSIIAALKKKLGDDVTTVFVHQGKYAHAPHHDDIPPDITVETIADLQGIGIAQFRNPAIYILPEEPPQVP